MKLTKRRTPDVIRQDEIKSLIDLDVTMGVIAATLKRRMDAGASVEPGEYHLVALDDWTALDAIPRDGHGREFNMAGCFDAVAYYPKVKNAPKKAA